jgi:hypothetical protein
MVTGSHAAAERRARSAGQTPPCGGAGLQAAVRNDPRGAATGGARPEPACVGRWPRYVSRTPASGAPVSSGSGRWLGCCTCSGKGSGGSMSTSGAFSSSTLPPRRSAGPLTGAISPVDFARQQLKRKKSAVGCRARGKRAEVTEPVMGEVATIQSAPCTTCAVAPSPGPWSRVGLCGAGGRFSGVHGCGGSRRGARAQRARYRVNPLGVRRFGACFGAPEQRSNRNRIFF